MKKRKIVKQSKIKNNHNNQYHTINIKIRV
jgi:hypothetical protein